MKTWSDFKAETLRSDSQPFMAWNNGQPMFQASYNPAYQSSNFIAWLRQQETLAKHQGATFCCVVMSSGKQENKKL